MIKNHFQEKFDAGEVLEFSPNNTAIILGSASPRRSRLLESHGIEHFVVVSSVDDTILNDEFSHDNISSSSAAEYTARMAFEKLVPFIGKVKNAAVICADTTIWCDRRILEKPISCERCIEQHKFISGKTNINFTAYAMYYNGKILEKIFPTEVKVAPLSNDIIEKILQDEEILDCAGYKNQGSINSFLTFNKYETDNLTGLCVQTVKNMLQEIKL